MYIKNKILSLSNEYDENNKLIYIIYNPDNGDIFIMNSIAKQIYDLFDSPFDKDCVMQKLEQVYDDINDENRIKIDETINKFIDKQILILAEEGV